MTGEGAPHLLTCCWPTYHTKSAKVSWLLATVGVIAMVLEWTRRPLRLAMVGVIVASVEALLISLALRERRADVLSIVHAWRTRKQS